MVVAKMSRTGTGRDQPRCAVCHRYGKVALFMAMSNVTVGIPHRSSTALYKKSVRASGVRSDGDTNSSYNEYICYANMSLCQKEHMGCDV